MNESANQSQVVAQEGTSLMKNHNFTSTIKQWLIIERFWSYGRDLQ